MIIPVGFVISFDFLNHKSEIERRTIKFIGLEYGISPHFPDEQDWFINGVCMLKNEPRAFKMRNISNVKISPF